MNMTWQKKTEPPYKTVLMSLLAGAAAGLTVGVLLAPKSGDKLRAEIGTAVDEYLESARHKADELRTSATNFAQRGLREVQKTKEVVVDKAEKLKGAVSSAVETGARDAHGAIDSTIAAANSSARKGHDAVNSAADALRTGTHS